MNKEKELEGYDLSALYRLFVIVLTHLACIEERKERQKSDTERRGIPTQPPWFFYVHGVQLRYTGSPLYVPIRRTMMNTMDIYNEKMNDVGASSGHRTRVFRSSGEICNRSTMNKGGENIFLNCLSLIETRYTINISA